MAAEGAAATTGAVYANTLGLGSALATATKIKRTKAKYLNILLIFCLAGDCAYAEYVRLSSS